jgi:hypothetical protein
MRFLVAAAPIVVTLPAMSGCRGDDAPPSTSGAPSSSARGSAASPVTIQYNPNGGSKVDGAPLHGDPKVCGALKSCCTVPALSLFCGMSQASTGGDCAKSLKEVRQYATEAHVATPAGCR